MLLIPHEFVAKRPSVNTVEGGSSSGPCAPYLKQQKTPVKSKKSIFCPPILVIVFSDFESSQYFGM